MSTPDPPCLVVVRWEDDLSLHAWHLAVDSCNKETHIQHNETRRELVAYAQCTAAISTATVGSDVMSDVMMTFRSYMKCDVICVTWPLPTWRPVCYVIKPSVWRTVKQQCCSWTMTMLERYVMHFLEVRTPLHYLKSAERKQTEHCQHIIVFFDIRKIVESGTMVSGVARILLQGGGTGA